MTDSDKVDELFEEADSQSRTDVAAESEEEQSDLAAEIAAQYHALRDQDASDALTLRDERLAAILRGLDQVDELGKLSEEIWADIEGEPSGPIDSRSTALAGLLRAGIDATDASLFETDETAYEQYRDEYENATR